MAGKMTKTIGLRPFQLAIMCKSCQDREEDQYSERRVFIRVKVLMFREAIGQKMENAYIVLYKLDLDIKYIGKQLGYTTSMT